MPLKRRSQGFIESVAKSQLKSVGLLDAAGNPVSGGDGDGMTIIRKEINTTDATKTSFGTLFTVGQNVALCNVRVISIEQTGGGGSGDWATFQWLGAVIEDSDNDGLTEIHNGTSAAAPDNSQGGASAIRLAIETSGSDLIVSITAIAGANYRHRLILEYTQLEYS